MFGFLNVYKPEGITSHDVVSRLRKVLKIKQIGHTGTLDPFAKGVLPVCIGKATRLIEYLNDEKAYLATLKFGFSTTTYDIEGEVLKTYDKKITEAELLDALKDFEGEISQMPPIYSAIKVKGKKLYEYARSGQDVEIKPRNVTIEKIELKSFDYEKQVAEIYIKCSKGTYIRSIAYDIGEKLLCGGHLVGLERVQAGKFSVENSVKLEDLTDVSIVQENLINPLKMLDLPIFTVDDKGFDKIKFGQMLTFDNVFEDKIGVENGSFVILIYNKDVENICAIAQIEEEKIKVKKVFI
ncbi:tRNA pseudouridine(55) synthase TruB [bacterium]|nr:tRNA pseudouridine(55) synthase TruB [bacterium]